MNSIKLTALPTTGISRFPCMVVAASLMLVFALPLVYGGVSAAPARQPADDPTNYLVNGTFDAPLAPWTTYGVVYPGALLSADNSEPESYDQSYIEQEITLPNAPTILSFDWSAELYAGAGPYVALANVYEVPSGASVGATLINDLGPESGSGQVELDLSSLAGKTVRVRFTVGMIFPYNPDSGLPGTGHLAVHNAAIHEQLGPNLVVNGGFEDPDLSSWNNVPVVVTSPVHSGVYAAYAEWFPDETHYFGRGGDCPGGNRIVLQPNTWYRWSAWSQLGSQGGDARAGVQLATTCSAPVDSFPYTSFSDNVEVWREASGVFQTGSDNIYAAVFLGLQSTGNGGGVYFDDVTLYQIATPTNTVTPTRTETRTPTITRTPRPSPTFTVTSTPRPCIFSDVCPGDYWYSPVEVLVGRGAISGYGDGTFRPYNNATRAQLAKIVTLAEGWTIDTSGGPHFSDVPPNNSFYSYVETAYAHGAISGYDGGVFRPYNNVTRGQIAKIIVQAEVWPIQTPAQPTFSDVPRDNPFWPFIETAYSHGAISGYEDGTFKWANNATRAQISKIVAVAISATASAK